MKARPPASPPRRRWLLRATAALAVTAMVDPVHGRGRVFTLVTLGDSILDCARYNDRGVHPGQLLVRNDDALFPAFRRRDLAAHGGATLDHRARDGSRIGDLAAQARGLRVRGPAVALVTVGGNDLLGGLAADRGEGVARFVATLDAFLARLAVRPVLLGTVYDPTFGDDARNFLGVPAPLARGNLARMNDALVALGRRYGEPVDLHAHFLRGDPSWFTRTIEPSLTGASELRAAFLPAVLRARG